MVHYYIDNREGAGYVVMRNEDYCNDRNGCGPIRNFGDRQTDAIEFRNDCRNGVIDESRIRLMVRTYTSQPYKYLGKGRLHKYSE